MPVDLLIKGGQVVTPTGVFAADIAIASGKIAGVGSAASLPRAQRTIDAKGLYVFPGLVDPHVHHDFIHHPFGEDCWTESCAAAAGGVTTVGFHLFKDGDGILKGFQESTPVFEHNAMVDGFFHVQIRDELGMEEVLKCPEHGVTSFKVTWGEQSTPDSTLFRAFEQIAKLGPIARQIIHAENRDIATLLRQRLVKAGRVDAAAWNDSRPSFCEAEAMIHNIFFARLTRCPIYIEHMTIAEGVEIAAKAKADGVDVIIETCPQYLTHTSQDPFVQKHPVVAHVNPPLRDKAANEALWRAIQTGVVDCIGSDHIPYKLKEKGEDLWEAPPGLGNLTEMILPVMLSEGVNKGRIPLPKVAELCCRNTARAFGLYPRKGSLQVGADADIVLADLNKVVKVSADIMHSASDYTIWDGWEFRGWPVMTLVRGQVVMQEGEIVGARGSGRYLRRPYK